MRYIFLLLTVFCSPLSAHAEEFPLTLKDTLRYVYYENPSILAARYGLKATEEGETQARAGWHPRVSAEAGISTSQVESSNFSTGDGATTKSASITVEQPVFRGFRTVSETEAAQYRIEADAEFVVRMQQDIFYQTAEAYMNVIRDRMILNLQRQNKELLAREKEAVTARFDAGDLTQTDVRQTEARYSKAAADDSIAESKLAESEAIFERLTGIWPAGTMAMPEVPFSFPDTQDDLIKTAALYNPQLAQARQLHEAAESDIRTAKSDFYPQVTAYATHLKEYDPQPGIVAETENSVLGITATISLYEGGSNLSRVREAKARANQRFVQIIQAEKEVRSDLIASWKKLRAYDAQIAARMLEVDAAKFTAEGVREEARLGERTVTDTLEAEQDVLDAETALVQARRDRIVTAYHLAAALGRLTPETLNLWGTETAANTP